MHRFLLRAFVLCCATAAAAGCGNNNTLGLGTPTTPTGPTTTTTFTGTLTTNGAHTHTFTAGGAGGVTAVLTTLSAPSGVVVSLVLGTWNGTVCQMILSNDSAIQGTTVLGQVSAASNLCVRIADASGDVTGPTAYQIDVTHP